MQFTYGNHRQISKYKEAQILCGVWYKKAVIVPCIKVNVKEMSVMIIEG